MPGPLAIGHWPELLYHKEMLLALCIFSLKITLASTPTQRADFYQFRNLNQATKLQSTKLRAPVQSGTDNLQWKILHRSTVNHLAAIIKSRGLRYRGPRQIVLPRRAHGPRSKASMHEMLSFFGQCLNKLSEHPQKSKITPFVVLSRGDAREKSAPTKRGFVLKKGLQNSRFPAIIFKIFRTEGLSRPTAIRRCQSELLALL